MEPEIRGKAKHYLRMLEQAIAAEAKQRSVPRGVLPALLPCNVLCVLTKEFLHVIFTNKNAGQVPRQVWIDSRERPIPSQPEHEFFFNYAVYELGFEAPRSYYESAKLLDASTSEWHDAVKLTAEQYVKLIMDELTRPRALPGYEGLQPLLDAFSADHPDFDKNVFIAMRFRGTEQFEEIDRSLRESLSRYGLKGHRADDKMYSVDHDLWNNVCV